MPLKFHFSFPLKMEYSDDSIQSCPLSFSQKKHVFGTYIRENYFKLLGFKSKNSEVEMDHLKYYLSAKLLFDTHKIVEFVSLGIKMACGKRRIFNHLLLGRWQQLDIRGCWGLPRAMAGSTEGMAFANLSPDMQPDCYRLLIANLVVIQSPCSRNHMTSWQCCFQLRIFFFLVFTASEKNNDAKLVT